MAYGGPIFVEATPGTMVEDELGLTAVRTGTIMATSQLDARAQLKNFGGGGGDEGKTGIEVGSKYTNWIGATPGGGGVQGIFAGGEEMDAADDIFCRSLQITPNPAATTGKKGLYEWSAQYRRSEGNEAVPGGDPVYISESSVISQPYDIQLNGYPVTNTAGELFDPPGQKFEPSEFLTVKQYVNIETNPIKVDPDDEPEEKAVGYFGIIRALRYYLGRVNTKSWHGTKHSEVLCHSIKPEPEGDTWLHITYRFEFRPSRLPSDYEGIDVLLARDKKTGKYFDMIQANKDRPNDLQYIPGFDQLQPNRGFTELNDDGELLNIRNDGDQERPKNPHYLDAAGKKTTVQEGDTSPQRVFLLVQPYLWGADFNNLGI